MTATKSSRIETITREISRMRPGHCGVKFGCLVWRVADKFIVGKSISQDDDLLDLEDAANLIDSLDR